MTGHTPIAPYAGAAPSPGTRRPAPVLVGIGLSAEGRPVVDSAELLSGSKTVIILHEGEEYRLELTRNGKLILKK